ncbi:MAG: hypothetical protein ACR2NU_09790 [Aeoliella sp.]
MDASPTNQSTPTPKPSRFHIQDSGRALWMITAFVLVSGLVALRALTGGANSPQVDVEATQNVPAVEPNQSDGLHTLRPQTSTIGQPSSMSLPPGYNFGPVSMDEGPADGALLPAAHWDPLTSQNWMLEPAVEIGATDEPEILR